MPGLSAMVMMVVPNPFVDCAYCAMLSPEERPDPPLPASLGRGGKHRTDGELRCVKHQESKLPLHLCLLCQKPVSDGRRRYHKLCKEVADQNGQLTPRRCSKCRKTKAASRFSNDSTRSSGKFPWCKSCQGETSLAKHFQKFDAELNGHVCPLCDTLIRGHKNRRFCSNKCKEKAGALRTKFGLTVVQYRKLIDDANGLCPMCGCEPKIWHVDHNHKTRLVTGVLCATCNTGLMAHSRHDLKRARGLVSYLELTPADRLGIIAYAPAGAHESSKMHTIWARNKYVRVNDRASR